MIRILIDKKNQLILLLGILFLIKLPPGGMRFAVWVLGGIVIAAVCDILIKRIFLKQRVIPASAVISGFITAGIIDYHQSWFTLMAFTVLAIFSKHIIRYKGKHIFNPANFALFVATLFGIPLTWNIESNIYLVVAFGIYMAYSIKKLPHVFGFFLFFSLLFVTQGMNPFTLASWFFIFVMLIEPRTSGFGSLRGFIFGSISGITSFLVFKFIPQYDFFVSSLFVANLSNLAWTRLKVKQG